MTPAWLGHFGLKESPFSKEIPDDDLWLPASKAQLVEEHAQAARLAHLASDDSNPEEDEP